VENWHFLAPKTLFFNILQSNLYANVVSSLHTVVSNCNTKMIATLHTALYYKAYDKTRV